MSAEPSQPPPRREIYDDALSGAQDQPLIPLLRGDPRLQHPPAHSLADFRAAEGPGAREQYLRALWTRLATPPTDARAADDVPATVTDGNGELSAQEAHALDRQYTDELKGRCHGDHIGPVQDKIRWQEFRQYAEAKEAELWQIFHDELDLDGNGHLDALELHTALQRAGIKMSAGTLAEFMTSLTASPHSRAVSFTDFRDFFLLLPRKVSTKEFYRYYEVRKRLGPDDRGAARLNMEGDVSLSAEDRPLAKARQATLATPPSPAPVDHEHEVDEAPEVDDEPHHWLGGMTALKFLVAGGMAGAVSRTATAPFDRLKIFLITRPPDLGGAPQASGSGARAIASAVARIYAEGGVRGFWVGNGLSIVKIFPESAIKFLSYESSKKVFAEYWDEVTDVKDISGVSRFMSGGVAGITSQLSIYPIETLKTRMMSSTGEQKRTLVDAARRLYQLGGVRAYYRGLTIGLVGVFPYAAIDMSTFEALKIAYLRSTGKTEPGVLATLAFGSVSGSVGATVVYPLNLVRTRLQAAGSSGHPQLYSGFRDAAMQTYRRDGWRGFYRGLVPTLTKVVPAVSISYVVYESSKRKLGV